MVSWGKSFELALKAILVGIGFAIIGVIIMAVGVGIYVVPPSAIPASISWVGIPIAILGFAISSIGFYAALIKYAVNEAVNEARGPSLSVLKTQSGTSVRTCPNCRTPLVWIEQEKRWYCPKDREYIP